jgi:hypothetical protein
MTRKNKTKVNFLTHTILCVNRGKSSARGRRSRNPANTSGRGQSQNNNQPSNKKFDKSKNQKHYCKKYGHYAYKWRKRQYNQNKYGQDQSNSANSLSVPMFMVRVEAIPIVSPVESMLLMKGLVTHGI